MVEQGTCGNCLLVRHKAHFDGREMQSSNWCMKGLPRQAFTGRSEAGVAIESLDETCKDWTPVPPDLSAVKGLD